MNTIVQTVPETVADHLRDVAVKFGLEDKQESYAALEKSWVEKMEVFEQEMIDRGMDEVGVFKPEDERAALLLTYSGSLISMSPLEGGSREIRYTSIGLRKDVPESMNLDHQEIEGCAEVGQPLVFTEGPMKKTSPLYRIVVPPLSLDIEEQTCMVEDAVTVITEKFADMNQKLLEDI
ncbi:MAG: hypothetical protein PQJ50_01230 [Spirochaetales bacterium]|nr:hypothetical protein [Spirochaetales bacterium]